MSNAQGNYPAVIITDQEYPVRPAFSLLTKLLDEFIAKVPQSSFNNSAAISFPDITTYIQKYQDPRQADTIMRVQQELDETKIVLVRISFWVSFCLYELNSFHCMHSIKQSNQFCNGERNSIILWRDQMHSPLQPRRFTRQPKRYRSSSSTTLLIFITVPQQNSCCVIM